jgi:hypothetical protein
MSQDINSDMAAYEHLAAVGPYAPAMGSALITMVEPFPGHEIAYNRWYEDDHFYAGALAMPWLFAGRRFVAPPALRALRFPLTSPIAEPITEGRYISLYWITAGRKDEHVAWSVATNRRLRSESRGFEFRKHIFTSFHDYIGPVYRDIDGPRDIHALDYPYGGIVVQIIDAVTPDAYDKLLHWMRETHLRAVQHSSGIAQTLLFRPQPVAPVFSDVATPPDLGDRITVVHFVDEHPSTQWAARFADHDSLVSASGLGRIVFCSPFIPTRPGTNDHAMD